MRKVSNIVIALSWLVAILAAIAAATGLFLKDKGTSFLFTTLHGQTTQILGQGLYRYDTVFIGSGFQAQDAVVLLIGVPILIIAIILYQRRSVRGQLLLTGILGYFLYLYGSMALGAAYNPLFLLYIVIFAASFWAFGQVLSATNLYLTNLYLNSGQISTQLPRRGLVLFMFAAGILTLMAWGIPLTIALINGTPPANLDSYTTMVTYALDLAIITPATFLSAVLVLQSKPWGYAIALPLLSLIILLAPQIVLSTIWQKSAGITLTRGEMIGPVAGFVILGAIAVWLLTAIVRGIARNAIKQP